MVCKNCVAFFLNINISVSKKNEPHEFILILCILALALFASRVTTLASLVKKYRTWGGKKMSSFALRL